MKNVYRIQKIITIFMLLICIRNKNQVGVVVCSIFYARTEILEIIENNYEHYEKIKK